jgi:hypothetical protein
MYKKYVAAAIVVILALAVPITIAALNQQQNFSMTGVGHYPKANPTADPTATPTATPTPAPASNVAFSLSFQNGTTVPASFSLTTDSMFYQTINGAPPMGYSPFLELNITNTGTLPINVAISFPNANFPSGMTYNFWSDMQDNWGFRNPTGNERTLGTIGVGQSEVVNLFGYLISSHDRDGSAFSYSLGASVSATQA